MTYSVSLLGWESRFFGFPIGGLELPADFSQEELEKAIQAGRERFRLICVSLAKQGPDLIATSDVPCVCYDRTQTFKKEVPDNVPSLNPHVKAYTSSFCSKWLERLAVQSGVLTRYKRDPELATQYERLFLTWINFSVSGEMADSIWTWREEDKHSGLITISCHKRPRPGSKDMERSAKIGMLAVDEAYRGKGIGQLLFEACDFWCSSLSIPTLAIEVQLDNKELIAICRKSGFQIDSEQSIYHYWSPGWVYDAHHGWLRLGYSKSS